MAKAKVKEANLVLEEHLRELCLGYRPEFKFCPERKWAADYAVYETSQAFSLKKPCLVEIEGGIWNNGAHVRGKHFLSDMEKYRMAAALGYKVFRFSTGEVLDGTAREFLRKWA